MLVGAVWKVTAATTEVFEDQTVCVPHSYLWPRSHMDPPEDNMVSAPARHWPPAPHGLVPRAAQHQGFNPKPVFLSRQEGGQPWNPNGS